MQTDNENSHLYSKKSPCSNCPYRIDAPRKHWSVLEFEKLMESELSYMGTVYGCHSKDGSVCIGWLMDQDERRFPSIALRISLSKNNIDRKYLDSLTSKSKRFKSVKQMCKANYPKSF